MKYSPQTVQVPDEPYPWFNNIGISVIICSLRDSSLNKFLLIFFFFFCRRALAHFLGSSRIVHLRSRTSYGRHRKCTIPGVYAP